MARAAARAGRAAGGGPGTYELVGFVSHIGKNTGSGHYVAHIKKDGRWVIFDDQKVALSAEPPLDLGYLYLYRRTAWGRARVHPPPEAPPPPPRLARGPSLPPCPRTLPH